MKPKFYILSLVHFIECFPQFKHIGSRITNGSTQHSSSSGYPRGEFCSFQQSASRRRTSISSDCTHPQSLADGWSLKKHISTEVTVMKLSLIGLFQNLLLLLYFGFLVSSQVDFDFCKHEVFYAANILVIAKSNTNATYFRQTKTLQKFPSMTKLKLVEKDS